MVTEDPLTLLDGLDVAVLVGSSDLERVYLCNRVARNLGVDTELLPLLREKGFARSGVHYLEGVTYYVRVVRLDGPEFQGAGLIVHCRAEHEPQLFRKLSTEDGITHKEFRVAKLIREGRPNDEISTILSISVAAAKRRIERIFRKLGVTSRAELVLAMNRIERALQKSVCDDQQD